MHNGTANFHAGDRALKCFRTDGDHSIRVDVRSMIRFKLFYNHRKMYTLRDILSLTTIHCLNLHSFIERNILNKKEEYLGACVHMITSVHITLWAEKESLIPRINKENFNF